LAKANLMETGKRGPSVIYSGINYSAPGYKMRKHIGAAISRRSAAVRNAVDKYNKMAPLQDPPRPLLQYSAIAAYSWLGEFELLKESRYEVLQRPWAKPAYREVGAKYYKIIRAREEIVRLDVEIRRLQTWLNDEDQHLLQMTAKLHTSHPIMSQAIAFQYAYQHRVNNVHRARLRAIYCLEGYSGHTMPGRRLGYVEVVRVPVAMTGMTDQGEQAIQTDLQGEEAVEVDEDDRLHDEAIRYTDVMENISTS
jgi:hypothetical protein